VKLFLQHQLNIINDSFKLLNQWQRFWKTLTNTSPQMNHMVGDVYPREMSWKPTETVKMFLVRNYIDILWRGWMDIPTFQAKQTGTILFQRSSSQTNLFIVWYTLHTKKSSSNLTVWLYDKFPAIRVCGFLISPQAVLRMKN